MPDSEKKRSRPQFDREGTSNEGKADGTSEQIRLWDESNPNLAPEPGKGPDQANRSHKSGSNVVEGSHGPNPVGLNPNRGLDKDDPNVGSPTLSTVSGEDADFESSRPKTPHEQLNDEIAAGKNNPPNDMPGGDGSPGSTEGPRDAKPYVDRPDPEDPNAPHNAAGPTGDYNRTGDKIKKSEHSAKSKY